MTNVFAINGGHQFAHSPGRFNQTLIDYTASFFSKKNEFSIKTTRIEDNYDLETEVSKFIWADIVIYHTPIWWFQVPFGFKEYIDRVFTVGHQNGIYTSDGRSSSNPAINYGTGGSLHGKKYILTTSWNAPRTAFELKGEFFKQKSVDEGPMYGFHKMNQFVGFDLLGTIHFYDIEKNADVPVEIKRYEKFLKDHFEEEKLIKQVIT